MIIQPVMSSSPSLVSVITHRQPKNVTLNPLEGGTYTTERRSSVAFANGETKGDGKKKKKSSFNWNHKNFIPSDPHLERLRKLTGRLIEEKMLSELRSDAIKASYDQSGEIKLELTNLPK